MRAGNAEKLEVAVSKTAVRFVDEKSFVYVNASVQDVNKIVVARIKIDSHEVDYCTFCAGGAFGKKRRAFFLVREKESVRHCVFILQRIPLQKPSLQ